MLQKTLTLTNFLGLASAQFEWRLAAPGEDCISGCKCLGCVEHSFPTTAAQVRNIELEDGFQCNTFRQSNSPSTPVYAKGGKCEYSITNTSTCSAKSAPGQRRICPCGRVPELGFLMGEIKSSCTEECLSIGATCLPTSHTGWPTSAEAFTNAFSDHECETYESSSSPLAPYKSGTVCYFPESTHVPDCDAFGDASEHRLCACKGIPQCMQQRAKSLEMRYQGPGEEAKRKNSPAKTCQNGGWLAGRLAPNRDLVWKTHQNHTFNSKEDCKAWCETRANGAVGVTYSEGGGICWCEVELTQYPMPDPTLEHCIFDSIVAITTTPTTTRMPITTIAPVGFYSMNVKPLTQASSRQSYLLSAALVVGAAIAVTGLAVLSWRRRGPAEAVLEEGKLLQD